jgi:hypothetical protein
MSHELETSPDPPPAQVGDIVRMQPIFEHGVLQGFAVIDTRTRKVLTLVPKENVTIVASAPEPPVG